MQRLGLGLILLALAPVAWLVGIFVDEDGSTEFVQPLLLMLAGLALAAWALPARRRVPAGIGFALAALAIFLFYDRDLWSGQANQAGGLFFLGCVAAVVGTGLGAIRVVGAGLVIVALGAAFWVYVDGANGGWVWQPGNGLAFAGATLAALGTFTQEK